MYYADCGQLPAGYKTQDTTYTGSDTAVTCDDEAGYSGTPQPTSVTCNDNGAWSTTTFTGCVSCTLNISLLQNQTLNQTICSQI